MKLIEKLMCINLGLNATCVANSKFITNFDAK